MIEHTTALYCIVDDLPKSVGYTDGRRCTMMDAEILTAALVAAHCCCGND
ncbi:MAG: hypothetical protein ABW250_14860 [Pyrinomonadaceae bacterium]